MLYLNFDGIETNIDYLDRWGFGEFSEPEYDNLSISTATEKNVVIDNETGTISSEYDFGHKLNERFYAEENRIVF